MYRIGLIVIVLCVFGAAAATAEFYKYVDQNGVVRYTDDASQIPDPEKAPVKKYKEVPLSPSPPAEEGVTRSPLPDDRESSAAAAGEKPEVKDASIEDTPVPSADFEQKRADLEKQKKRLDEDYRVLAKDLENLQAQRDEANTKRQVKAYNERAAALNRQIEAYEKKREALDKKVKAYNDSVSGSEKPSPDIQPSSP